MPAPPLDPRTQLIAALDEIIAITDTIPDGYQPDLTVWRSEHDMPHLRLVLRQLPAIPRMASIPDQQWTVQIIDYTPDTTFDEGMVAKPGGGEWLMRVPAAADRQPAGWAERREAAWQEYQPTAQSLIDDVIAPHLQRANAGEAGPGMWSLRTPHEYVTRERAAQVAGVTVHTWDQYRSRGLLPEPDMMVVRTPLWQVRTIREWMAARPGRGAGGGRPKKVAH